MYNTHTHPAWLHTAMQALAQPCSSYTNTTHTHQHTLDTHNTLHTLCTISYTHCIHYIHATPYTSILNTRTEQYRVVQSRTQYSSIKHALLLLGINMQAQTYQNTTQLASTSIIQAETDIIHPVMTCTVQTLTQGLYMHLQTLHASHNSARTRHKTAYTHIYTHCSTQSSRLDEKAGMQALKLKELPFQMKPSKIRTQTRRKNR